MKYVYLLQSLSNPKKRYAGVSVDFQERLSSTTAANPLTPRSTGRGNRLSSSGSKMTPRRKHLSDT